ncbi:hypothetical protein Aduo_001700 [Ancylostoma duodenale]
MLKRVKVGNRRCSNVEPVNVEDVKEDLIIDDVPYQEDVEIESEEILVEEPLSQRAANANDSYSYATVPRSH